MKKSIAADSSAPEKIRKAYSLLMGHYGKRGWWPLGGKYYLGNYSLPGTGSERFEICAGAILAQNTTWKNAGKAVMELGKHRLLSSAAILKIPEKRLASIIRQSGYHNQKAKKLKAFARYNGPVTREGLLSVWGIGNETADSILLYAFREAIFVIDAYTKRIFSRVGICSPAIEYGNLQEIFHSSLRKDYRVFNEYHALLVELGKDFCRKKSPVCAGCPLLEICRFGKTALPKSSF